MRTYKREFIGTRDFSIYCIVDTLQDIEEVMDSYISEIEGVLYQAGIEFDDFEVEIDGDDSFVLESKYSVSGCCLHCDGDYYEPPTDEIEIDENLDKVESLLNTTLENARCKIIENSEIHICSIL